VITVGDADLDRGRRPSRAAGTQAPGRGPAQRLQTVPLRISAPASLSVLSSLASLPCLLEVFARGRSRRPFFWIKMVYFQTPPVFELRR